VNRNKLFTLTTVLAALAWTAVAFGAGSGLEHLYILDCGETTIPSPPEGERAG